MPSQSKVCFFYQGVRPGLPNRTRLKQFIEFIFKKEGWQLESLNCIFCTDQALLAINNQYLSHNYFTDIITFDLSDTKRIRGEVYISTDRVRDNAGSLGLSIKEELLRVIFHGVLHLCGYRDKKPAEIAKMRQKEDYYLKRWKTLH
jgi:probable rRNA maturation factor